MNHLSRIVKPLAGSALLIITICLATGQGDLEPPAGPPAPNMKTLQEIWDKLDNLQTDPRTPITSLPTTISQPGSYYLAGNFEFNNRVSSAIEISADNVTLDLNGFTLSSTNAVIMPAIDITGNYVTVHNGNIVGTTTVSPRPEWTVTEGGFQTGISGIGRGYRIRDISVSGCRTSGIDIGTDSVLANCTSSQNGSDGIRIARCSIARDCTAHENGREGIYALGGTVSRSSGRQNGGHGIWLQSGNAIGCIAFENDATGIAGHGVGTVTQCSAEDNRFDEIQTYGATRALNQPTP